VRRQEIRRGTLDFPTASLIFVVGTETYLQPADSCLRTLNRALARGQNYESGGRRFESFRARQFLATSVCFTRHSHGTSEVHELRRRAPPVPDWRPHVTSSAIQFVRFGTKVLDKGIKEHLIEGVTVRI
jgi:hypothetical protein